MKINFLALVHLLVGVLIIGLCLPLIRRKVPMDHFYGVRIPKAFSSERTWYDLNEYGGRLFLRWGVTIAAIGLAGAVLPKYLWQPYKFAALAVIIGGLALVVILIFREAGRYK